MIRRNFSILILINPETWPSTNKIPLNDFWRLTTLLSRQPQEHRTSPCIHFYCFAPIGDDRMIDRMLCASLMIRICTSGQTHSLRCDIVITASDGGATMCWYIYIYVYIDTSVYMSKRVSVCENRPISHQNKHHLYSDSTEQTAHRFTSNTCVWHDRVMMCAIRNLDFKEHMFGKNVTHYLSSPTLR